VAVRAHTVHDGARVAPGMTVPASSRNLDPALHTVLVAAALSFVWLGMVLAISFLETPLKFRAPG
jgi:hypothetical protein